MTKQTDKETDDKKSRGNISRLNHSQVKRRGMSAQKAAE